MNKPIQASGSVTARCVACGKTREIGSEEVARGDVPVCDVCYSPMVAVRARVTVRKTKR